MTEKDIVNLIQNDKWMMRVLEIARDLNLPQWMIGAGFVRNKVWDCLSGNTNDGVDTADIDLIYFNPNGNDEKADEELSERLSKETGINWEVVNEYYAHKWNNSPPYASTEDVTLLGPETATAVWVTLDENNKLKLFAPYGIEDLVNFIVRPSPKFKGGIEKVRERVRQKGWDKKWPRIKIRN